MMRPQESCSKSFKSLEYFTALLLLIIGSSCINKGYILKKGEAVTIPGQDINIEGILYRPEKSEGKSPALVILHGWSQYDTKPVELSAIDAWLFSREGYVALALSLRGWPETGGKDDCGEKQSHDVVDVIRWLSGQPGVDPQRIGLFGCSMGGQIALLSAALTDKVKAVVAYFPVTELGLWADTADLPWIKNWYLPNVCSEGAGTKSRSPIYVADKINAATLLVHGDQDTRVPIEQSIRMAEAMRNSGKNVRLHVVEGGTHTPRPEDDEWKAAYERVKEFFKKNLK